jgi:hypothetical protein
MTPTEVLHSAFRTATAPLGAVRSSSRRGALNTHVGVIGLCLIALTACSNRLTAPSGGIDRDAVARVMPAVTDARVRLTSGLGNVPIRQQVILELSDLELALRSGDAMRAQSLVQQVTSVVTDPRTQSSFIEGADKSAIFLMLQTVSEVVGPGNSATP